MNLKNAVNLQPHQVISIMQNANANPLDKPLYLENTKTSSSLPISIIDMNPWLFPEAKGTTEILRKKLRISYDYKKAPHIEPSPNVLKLHNAAYEGDLNTVKEILAKGEDPNATDENGATALHHAAWGKQIDVLSYLLLEVPELDLNATDLNNRTVLHIASKKIKDEQTVDQRSGLLSVCSLLLGDPRIFVDAKDKKERTALCMATRANCYYIVLMLITRGANINLSDCLKRTALHYACQRGQKNIVEALIEAGADCEVKDQDGCRPVHFAANRNFIEIIRYLKSHGVQLDPNDNAGRTPHNLTNSEEIKWLIEERYTTTTHPLQIDFVTHKKLGKAKIGMSMCPGRNKKNWRRNLEDDIALMKKMGIQSVVTLVTQEELNAMRIPDLQMKLNEKDIETIHYPISDKWIPASLEDLIALVQMILNRIRRENCILVHCNGGKGRTGLVVVATLVALRVDPNEAVNTVRKAREGMIRNPAQLIYVRAFAQEIEKMRARGTWKDEIVSDNNENEKSLI